jgi:hypothetical protein
MTPQEYQEWLKETQRSENRWQLDPIHTDTKLGTLFAYTGGVNGNYVWVAASKVTIGTYSGAIPHIGEAEFKIAYESREYANNAEASKAAFEGMGVKFLLDLISE